MPGHVGWASGQQQCVRCQLSVPDGAGATGECLIPLPAELTETLPLFMAAFR
jgi:hypothetical protein